MNKLNEIFEKVFVVSFKESPRLVTLSDRLHGLDYEIWFGPNKKDIDLQKVKDEGWRLAHPPFNHGEAIWANAFTHLELLKFIRKQNYQKNCLVLEDDVLMYEDKIDHAVECYNNLPDDWDLFYIGTATCNYNYDRLIKNNYKDLIYKGNGDFPIEGMNAYVLNKDGKFFDWFINQTPQEYTGIEPWSWYDRINYFCVIPQVFPQINNKEFRYKDYVKSEIGNNRTYKN